MKSNREVLRSCLEEQSKTVEAVLKRYGMTAVVTGGKVTSRTFQYHVQILGPNAASQTVMLESELARTLAVSEVEIVWQENGMTISVSRELSKTLHIQNLLETVGEVRPLTAVLGAASDGSPITLHLPTSDVSNILVAGQTGAGKTTLLRTLLYSLAVHNKQHQLQALVIDYDPTGQADGPLAAFSHTPHLLRPVAETFKEAVNVLDFLVGEMDYRIKHEVSHPKILLVIDNLDLLVEAGQGPLLMRLLSLLQYGATAGIHLVLAIERPTGQNVNQLLKCELPLRFIGKVSDDKMARAVAGVLDTGAEYLLGRGDFIGINGPHQVRFRSAYIGDYDLYLGVEGLNRQSPKKLVAAKTVHPDKLELIGGG